MAYQLARFRCRIYAHHSGTLARRDYAHHFRFVVPIVPLKKDTRLAATSTQLQLVDWRDWEQMKSTYAREVHGHPLLIVDAEPIQVDKDLPTTTTYVIPEATVVAEESSISTSTSVSTSAFVTVASSTSSTTSTTTASTPIVTANDEITEPTTTTSTVAPDVTLQLRNLPDMMTLLKHLALIPAVVRSFSSAAVSSANNDAPAATNPIGALLTANAPPRVDELHSRALSANSGYNARSPSFVTATPSEAEPPQVKCSLIQLANR